MAKSNPYHNRPAPPVNPPRKPVKISTKGPNNPYRKPPPDNPAAGANAVVKGEVAAVVNKSGKGGGGGTGGTGGKGQGGGQGGAGGNSGGGGGGA
jgi:hypothetical protein